MKKKIAGIFTLALATTFVLASCKGKGKTTNQNGGECDEELVSDTNFDDKDADYTPYPGSGSVTVGPWNVYGMSGGKADMYVEKGELVIEAKVIDYVDYCIQLAHKALPIGAGSKYVISFDCRADKPQTGNVLVQKDASPYTAYFKEEFKITTKMTHYEYEFESDYTDKSSSYVFNLGKYDGDGVDSNKFYFDNISLKCVYDSGIFNKEKKGIVLNQVGYLPNSQKKAVFRQKTSESDVDTKYVIKDAKTNKVVYNGTLAEKSKHLITQEFAVVADFSDFTTPGTYYLEGDICGKSNTFEIKDNVYDDLYASTLRFLYLQRCGCKVEDETFGHAACHTELAEVYGNKSEKIDVSGGWHDAGDYGKYVVAGVKTLEDLFIAYEKSNDSKILEEAKYELDWMLKMQKSNGEVYHKVTTYDFPDADTLAVDDRSQLVLSPTSYAATADFSAIMARAAKIYASSNPTDAAKYKTASINAYNALASMEKVSYDNPYTSKDEKGNPNYIITTGKYDDAVLGDELEYAAIALYNLTGESQYIQTFETNLDTSLDFAYGWDNMTGYAYREYLKNSNPSKKAEVVAKMQAAADKYIANMNDCPYSDPISGKHCWGSNLTVCSAAMLLMDLEKVNGTKYTNQIQDVLDHLLGRNYTEYCFVTGFGEVSPQNPHHRPSVALEKAMPGMLVGGPDNDYKNNGGDIAASKLDGISPEGAYTDDKGSWSTNEVTIYWNSPLIALLSYYK